MKPAASAPAREAPPAAAAGGGPSGEFFTALGTSWQLTAAQRAKLAPAVAAALDAGWTPPALAAFAGANTAGVRNQYAVLAARLSPAQLPPPRQQRNLAAAVVRGMRPNHPDARLRQRCATTMPTL